MASSQYSIAKHTILPLILKISHKHSLSYLIKDPITSSLILFPSLQQPDSLKQHVNNIQKEFGCNLTHTIYNSNDNDHKGPFFNEKVVFPHTQGQLKPQLVGELSLCFIKAAGYKQDYNLIAATHISATSTKFPVLFVGNMLSVCSIDIDSPTKSNLYLETINKLKYFPNETYIFPSQKPTGQDLQFASALQKHAFLDNKIQIFKSKGKQLPDCLIPTSILQQKILNPFLNSHKYSNLLKTTDRAASFDILRKMRRQWKRQ